MARPLPVLICPLAPDVFDDTAVRRAVDDRLRHKRSLLRGMAFSIAFEKSTASLPGTAFLKGNFEIFGSTLDNEEAASTIDCRAVEMLLLSRLRASPGTRPAAPR